MEIILGVDPGSRATGYAIIQKTQSQLRPLNFGTIKTQGDCFSERLFQIFSQLEAVIHQYQPQNCAIESVFMHKNAQSALKLGQARGAALTAFAKNGLNTHEYSPREVKLAVAGYGGANKEQIQQMVRMLLKIKQPLQADAADALAIAICHCHTQQLSAKLQQAKITAGDGA